MNNMKKVLASIIILSAVNAFNFVQAQRIDESCEIIATSIKDGQYKEFTIDGAGYLSYLWTDNKGSETSLKIDLTQVTISKDVSMSGYKVWVNCIDGTNCITEKGIVGDDQNYYSEFPRTYLPAKSESDMNAIYYQMEYLLKLANGIR